MNAINFAVDVQRPDHNLLALGTAWDHITKANEALPVGIDTEPMLEIRDQIEKQIAGTTAITPAGLAVKLRLASVYDDDGDDGEQLAEGAAVLRELRRSALRDVEAMATTIVAGAETV